MISPDDPARRLLVVMDPIDAIDPRKDSTLAMLLEAQRRDWSVQYAEMGDIWLRDGIARGRVTVACVSHDDHGGMKAVPIPKAIAEKIEVASE